MGLDGSIVNDVKSFTELLIDNLAGIVQYNGLQSEDIFSVCAILTDESVGSPLERLGAVNTMMLGENGEECLDHTYETFIAQLKTSTVVEVSVGGLGSGKHALSLDGTRQPTKSPASTDHPLILVSLNNGARTLSDPPSLMRFWRKMFMDPT